MEASIINWTDATKGSFRKNNACNRVCVLLILCLVHFFNIYIYSLYLNLVVIASIFEPRFLAVPPVYDRNFARNISVCNVHNCDRCCLHYRQMGHPWTNYVASYYIINILSKHHFNQKKKHSLLLRSDKITDNHWEQVYILTTIENKYTYFDTPARS